MFNMSTHMSRNSCTKLYMESYKQRSIKNCKFNLINLIACGSINLKGMSPSRIRQVNSIAGPFLIFIHLNM